MFIYFQLVFQSGRVPLHWAASGGQTAVVEFLLSHGVKIDPRDDVCIYFKNLHYHEYCHITSIKAFLENAFRTPYAGA